MYQIYQGDCIDVMNNIQDKSIDMILCDLPYGITENVWDNVIDYEKLWNHYKRIIKDNGAIVLFSCQRFTHQLIMTNFKMFRYEWIWIKSKPTGFLNANKMPLRIHENILVFYKKLPTYNAQGLEQREKPLIKTSNASHYGKYGVKSISTHTNYPSDVLYFNSVVKPSHPTEKPIDLLEYLIKTYTNEGETVLDNCMGSGSTGIACLRCQRNFIGIELNEEYYYLSKNRLEGEVSCLVKS